MVQLFVYSTTEGTKKYELDLFETDPVKLTLTAESITDAGEIESTYSRNFRLPQSKANDDFFKWWFNVNGIDFDVTKKINAELWVNGVYFKAGQLRLSKIFVNRETEGYEYEVLFLGAIRNFASAVGEGFLNSLDFTAYNHEQTPANIALSWQAYPQGSSTAGLFNGNILYPMIDFGNTYTGSGSSVVTVEPRMATDNGVGAYNYITNPVSPAFLTQFKPMIRVKAVLDKIFAGTPYTYQSTFLNSLMFKKLYMSAFGNVAGSTLQVAQGNTFNVANGTQFLTVGVLETIKFLTEVSDPSNLYDYTSGEFTAPVTGTYKFSASVNYYAEASVTPTSITVPLQLYKNGVNTGAGTANTANFATTVTFTNSFSNLSLSLVAGDKITLRTFISLNYGGIQTASVTGGNWGCVEAPGSNNFGNLLSSKTKKIDFVKSILRRFRLVMVPSPDDASKFIIEPWNDYIAKGSIYNWDQKLITDKDMVIEPVFYTQSATDTFEDLEGKDVCNQLNILNKGTIYGMKQYISGNELLTGDRAIESVFAPTPIRQIEGTMDAGSNWVIPQLHRDESKDALAQHIPVEVEPRLLFYNGLVTINPVQTWYLTSGPGAGYTSYPLVSYHETWPPTSNSINLNWQIEAPYYGTNIPGVNGISGISVYDKYWSTYINSLYDPYARKLTAYFNLNIVDIQDLSFDDVIWTNDAYWRVQKIYDMNIGETGPVKVDLIKLLSYNPGVKLEAKKTYKITNTDANNIYFDYDYYVGIVKTKSTQQVLTPGQSITICAILDSISITTQSADAKAILVEMLGNC
jgi:hypothetical protein